MPKAIMFTGTSVPPGATSVIVQDGNTGATDTKLGFVLTPLGDGSWAGLATVYPGGTYNYYFEYRIPVYDETDSSQSFLYSEHSGARNDDANRVRTVTIPVGAGNGYVVYNVYGDRSVWGGQSGDTTLTIANPFLANWQAALRISPTTDDDTSGRDETNNYNVAALQLGAGRARLSWEINMGNGLVPHVEGASTFLSGVSPAYGFEILRAESNPLLPLTSLTFQNITTPVTGWPIFSPDPGSPWNSPAYFYDTEIVAAPDSVFVYTVRTRNAYGMTNTETQQLSWSGGYSVVKWVAPAVEVDGSIEGMYGSPIATDPNGDQNLANLDLTRMWATRDDANFYFALEIPDNIFQNVWGRYVILIDVNGDTNGAPTMKYSNLGSNYKNIAFPGHRPEYALVLHSSNDATGPPANVAELYYWNGSDWFSQGNTYNVAASTDGETSWIEVAVPYTWPSGVVPRLWLEAYSTGGSGNDPARDVINKLTGDSDNNEWNMLEWTQPNGQPLTTTAKLSVSTPFPPPLLPPIAVNATAWDTKAYIQFLPPAQNIHLVDHFEIFFDSDISKVLWGDPSAKLTNTGVGSTFGESSGLQTNVRYYARVFSVSSDGRESSGSNLAYCDIRGATDTIVTQVFDSTGVTIVEIPEWAWNLTYGDTYFTVEILNYDEIWTMAHFNDSDRMIALEKIHAANSKMFFNPAYKPISGGVFPDTLSAVRQVTVRRPNGAKAPANYFAEVHLRIPYRTYDSSTLMSPGVIKENTLVVRKLDETGVEWSKPNTEKTQWVETDSDKVRIITSEFSIWTVLAAAGTITNLDRIAVYPNPFNARDYIAAGHPPPAVVTFAFIPTSTERIEIFNIAGERVRTLDRTDAREFESDGINIIGKWDAKNDHGRDVASGVYIFWIRANGQVKVGKVAIIK
ncbi:MAG: T9SS type A sorting domain-containing protein, partial [Candidatus Hydrogenedentota bacterium]